MESYQEYPIRCKSCNEQIACFAESFMQLLNSGFTIEESLNELGITAMCSRAAFMTPTNVAFDMENRDLIEGLRNINEIEDEEIIPDPNAKKIFGTCIASQLESVPAPRPSLFPKGPIIPPKVAPITTQGISLVKPIDFTEGIAIPITGVNVETEFQEPTIPGIPTININRSIPETKVHVGAGKYAVVLSGRTYLAQ